MILKKATRSQAKIKMSISAPTGFGKTYSALLLAFGMTNDWNKIAVIDSENDSANLYADLGEYNVLSMKPPYTVDSFCEAVKTCADAGMEVIIVDSTYHYWHGKGGLLEFNSSLGGNSFAAWAKTNPIYSKWMDAILQTPCHIICTNRKKQAYELSKDSSGKTTVEKKGMEDQIRDGFSYEMTISFNIENANHLVEVDKDRTRLFTGKQAFVISHATGAAILEWCNTGKSFEDMSKEKEAEAIKKAEEEKLKYQSDLLLAITEMETANDLNSLKAIWSNYKAFQKEEKFLHAKDLRKSTLTPTKESTPA